MSYLLDALRKAERERHPERAPDLTQWHAADAADRREGLPGWVLPVVAALVLLNAGVLLMFWFTEQAAVPEASGGDAIDAVRSSPHPAPAPEAATSASRSRVPDAPAAPASMPEETAAVASDDFAEPADSIAALPAATRSRLPPIDLNGHLYSSIPGRSFLLVNGRRYREGERLREGPAVESIDETGAVLKYHGERFRVAAPR